jgi:hypothetical protein
MAVKLHASALDYAKELIRSGHVKADKRDDWSEHRPTAEEENRFISAHGYNEYGKWFLGIDDERPAQTKGRYEFPIGDFKAVHLCGVLAAESRAGQYKHADIESAAAHLHGMIIAKAKERAA